jgi:3-oxoacyl-[acyl-carrier protein] reductase
MKHSKKGRLQGKVAIVTGGARGIGKATGYKMLKEGAKVALIDLLNNKLSEIRDEFITEQDKVLTLCIDITDENQVQEAVRKTVQEFGTIDILVNNAGIVCPAPLEDVKEAEWDDVVAVNLKGSFFCTKAVVPTMKGKRSGSIINIGSRASLGKHDRTVYSATKSGLIGMTRTWALELAPFNINVNYLGPGLIATDLFRSVNPSDSEKTKRLISAIPLHRLGEPKDLASVISFFASDEASYVTGQTLFICGGLSIHSY